MYDENIRSVAGALDQSLTHIDYLLSNEKLSFIDNSSLTSLRSELAEQIDKLKSLYETKA
ncbi:hypothetical protein ABTM53_25110 [Acinetobacter baumannii]